MLYTDMLTAVMRMATPTLRRYALFLSVRRMEHRLTIICKRNWTCKAHVVTEGEVRDDVNEKKRDDKLTNCEIKSKAARVMVTKCWQSREGRHSPRGYIAK